MARLQDVLRRLADELDTAEAEERNADSERERREASERVERLEAEIAELRASATVPPPSPPPPVVEPPVTPPVEPPPPEPQVRTRRGRKSGQLYDEWPDEETGELVKLDIPRVYTGEDEPDEVEIRVAEAS